MLEQSPKTGVQNTVVTKGTTPLPGSVGVAVFRESRAVCWADGKLETSNGSICFLEKLLRAELKQCCEVLGQAAMEGYRCCEEGSSCSLVLYVGTPWHRLACLGTTGKKINSCKSPSEWHLE